MFKHNPLFSVCFYFFVTYTLFSATAVFCRKHYKNSVLCRTQLLWITDSEQPLRDPFPKRWFLFLPRIFVVFRAQKPPCEQKLPENGRRPVCTKCAHQGFENAFLCIFSSGTNFVHFFLISYTYFYSVWGRNPRKCPDLDFLQKWLGTLVLAPKITTWNRTFIFSWFLGHWAPKAGFSCETPIVVVFGGRKPERRRTRERSRRGRRTRRRRRRRRRRREERRRWSRTMRSPPKKMKKKKEEKRLDKKKKLSKTKY